MAAQIRFLALLLLSALFVTGQANLLDANGDCIVYGKTVNISSLVDVLLPSIRKYVLSEGLDPLGLDNIHENLQGVIVGGKYIDLTNGQLQGLSEITRTGDALLIHNEDNTYTLDVTFGFDVFDANFDYTYKGFLITRTGELNGRFNNIEIKIIADANLKERKVVLRAVNIVRIGNMSIKLKGHKLDAILNAIIKRITTKFRNSIIKMVEKQGLASAQKYLDKMIQNYFAQSNQFLIENDILRSVPVSYDFIEV